MKIKRVMFQLGILSSQNIIGEVLEYGYACNVLTESDVFTFVGSGDSVADCLKSLAEKIKEVEETHNVTITNKVVQYYEVNNARNKRA